MMKYLLPIFFVVITATTFLNAEEAVVVDLSGTRFGSPEMVQEVLSHQQDAEELIMRGIYFFPKDTYMDLVVSGTYELLKKMTLDRTQMSKLHFPSHFAPSLEELSMVLVNLGTTIDLTGLENFPALRVLDLRSTQIPSQNLADVTLLNLEELYIDGRAYFRTPLSTFAPNLRVLSFLSDSEGLMSLSLDSMANLEVLDLSDSRHDFTVRVYGVTNAQLEYLGLIPSLKSLSLVDRRIYEGADFTALHRLETLNMGFYNHHDAQAFWESESGVNFDLRQLNSFESLQTLDLSGRWFSAANIEQMQYVSIPSLQILHLNDTKVKGAKFATFAPNLKELSLAVANITGGDIAEIVLIDTLESLKIGGKSFTGSILKKLGKLTMLRKLTLAGTNMSKADFNELPPSLEHLDLSGSTLSLASFNTLQSLTHLKKLNLSGIDNANITPAMIDALQRTLPTCHIVR